MVGTFRKRPILCNAPQLWPTSLGQNHPCYSRISCVPPLVMSDRGRVCSLGRPLPYQTGSRKGCPLISPHFPLRSSPFRLCQPASPHSTFFHNISWCSPRKGCQNHSRNQERIFPKIESTFHARFHGSQVKFQASKNVLSRFPFPTSQIANHFSNHIPV